MTRAVILATVGLIMLIGVVMWITGAFSQAAVGYPAIWLFSFIGAASVFIPLPAPAVVCAGAAPALGLNPVAIGIVSGSAEALGELTGYLAGATGRSALEGRHWYPRIKHWVERRGALVLFCMAVIPNPLFDIVGIAAGSVGYPVRKFLPVVFLAKAIKSTGIATACYYGISLVQRGLN